MTTKKSGFLGRVRKFIFLEYYSDGIQVLQVF